MDITRPRMGSACDFSPPLSSLNHLPSPTPIPYKRLIARTHLFHQSSWDVNIRWKTTDSQTKWSVRSLILKDWFDVVLAQDTWVVTFWLVALYTVQLLVWAGFYEATAFNCPTSPNLSFQAAFAFSLETATTVGFGLPFDVSEIFFGGCSTWIVVIYWQLMVSLFLNGLVLGTIMLRVQRPNRRARQVIFGDKACILCLRGRFYLTFQVFDMQGKVPILSAMVKCLAVFHEPDEGSPAYYQTRAMRLIRPDDELGAKLWLSAPCLVIHEIDQWSPLAPLILTQAPEEFSASAPNRFPQPVQRSSDGRCGSRSQNSCPVCGAPFSTDAALRRHVAHRAHDEKLRNRPADYGHCVLSVDRITRPIVSRLPPAGDERAEEVPPSMKEVPVPLDPRLMGSKEVPAFVQPTNKLETSKLKVEMTKPRDVTKQIKQRITNRGIEVVCVVEGIDPRTSNVFQARHSYCIEDVEFNKQHIPCSEISADGSPRVNLSKFHMLYAHPEGANIEEPIPFSSHS